MSDHISSTALNCVSCCSRLWRAQKGAVAIYVAFVTVIMMGFGALVVDAGRAFTLQTELQKAADAAATTGAAELDQTPTAITRARAAAKTALISNIQTFASGGKDVVINDADIRFLSSLPANDDTPIPASMVTTDPVEAHFIQVSPAVREVDYLLGPVLAAFFGNEGDQLTKGKATATAVAGLQTYVCKFPPMMICNPHEDPLGGGAFSYSAGELLVLKQGGGTGDWTPGNFGLLDPPTGNQGTAAVVENLATAQPSGCFTSPVDLRTGNVANPVSTAMNTRFDMYEDPKFGPDSGASGKSKYKPAPNVTKGKYLPPSATSFTNYPSPIPKGSRGMPKHGCLASACDIDGTTSNAGATNTFNYLGSGHPRFALMPTDAAGQAAFWEGYWNDNHSGVAWNPVGLGIDTNGDGIVTRKEMYDWEIADSKIPTGDTDGNTLYEPEDEDDPSSATGENGRPMNYTNADPPDPKRREMNVAVINCIENGPLNGNTDNVPVLGYATLFLTNPAEGGSDQTIYSEITDFLTPATDTTGVVHDNVQLFR